MFPRSLPDPTTVPISFSSAGVIALLALLGLLAVGFPAEVLNKTVEENYDEIAGWFRARRLRAVWSRLPVPSRFSSSTFSTLTSFAVFASVAAAITVFAEHDLRRNAAITFASVVVALVVTTLAFEVPIAVYTRLGCGKRCSLRLYPGAVAMAVVCAVASRLWEFTPPYVYGIIAGYAVHKARTTDNKKEEGDLTPEKHGRAVLLASLSLLVVSLAAWSVWTVLHTPGSSGVRLVAESILAAIVVAGVSGLVFGLVPLTFLDGEKLVGCTVGPRALRRRWLTWVVVYGFTLFLFFFMYLDPAVNDDLLALKPYQRDVLVNMVTLFVAFGTLSCSVWGYFRFRRPRRSIVPVAERAP